MKLGIPVYEGVDKETAKAVQEDGWNRLVAAIGSALKAQPEEI